MATSCFHDEIQSKLQSAILGQDWVFCQKTFAGMVATTPGGSDATIFSIGSAKMPQKSTDFD